MKNTLKTFLIFAVLLFFNYGCQEEDTLPEQSQDLIYTAPNIANAQQFFQQNSNIMGSLTSRTTLTSLTDWDASKTKTYKQTEATNVDILYTPVYISTRRTDVKVFLASTERNGMVDARKIYILYKSNDLSNGLSAYIFVFDLEGRLEYLYNYENGQQTDLAQGNSIANRSDTGNCGGDPSQMNDAQFEEWFNNCNNSIDEVIITVDNTPQGGNGTGLDFSPWVPVNLPPVQGGGNNPGGSGVNIGGGTAWYVPNTVSANSFSITLALGIAPNSDIGNWLAQQTGNNQDVLDAIATYLNNNRDRGNTGNTNNPNTNEGTDNPFEWQLPISDDAIDNVMNYIGSIINEETTWFFEHYDVYEDIPGEVINLDDYLDCFNSATSSDNFKLTVFVDQPIANDDDTWVNNGTLLDPEIDVGHTFIGIQMNQGGAITNQTIGFYPSSGVNPLNPDTTGAWIDDGAHHYDVSVSIDLNYTEFTNLINFIQTYGTPIYDLNSENCTDAAIDIANSAGMGLTDTHGTWPGGGCSNPGNLGQDVRGIDTPGLSVNNTPGHAPLSSGACD